MLRRLLVQGLVALAVIDLGACATLPDRDPLQVTVAGIEPLQGEGLELRLLVKLRVQNPNDAPVEYDGVSLNLDVQGKSFASGVSDASGTVPRFGESVIGVPVTVSMLRMVRQVMGMVDGQPVDRITYSLQRQVERDAVQHTAVQGPGRLLPAAVAAAGRQHVLSSPCRFAPCYRRSTTRPTVR